MRGAISGQGYGFARLKTCAIERDRRNALPDADRVLDADPVAGGPPDDCRREARSGVRSAGIDVQRLALYADPEDALDLDPINTTRSVIGTAHSSPIVSVCTL